MLVEILNLDNGSGVNTNFDVYLAYNEPRKLFEQRPYCRIDESDFCDILTDSQIEKLVTGTIQFRVNKIQLEEKSNKIY